MPQFSIIVPVFNQATLLAQCLASIRACAFTDYELLVADDGTPEGDEIRRIAGQFGARLVRSEARQGSAAARNRAARVATGELLAFFDADVTLHPDTLMRLARAFEEDPRPDAVMGSYDRRPGAPGRVSQFRNLLHAHTHHRSHREARTFWSACGAMRRDRFEALGGFDESYDGPSIEDVELGLRLYRAGGRIILAPEIQVTHHKKWTLRTMVNTDLFRRAIPWTVLLREHSLPRDLNFRVRDRVAAALTALLPFLLAIAWRHGTGWWGVLAVDICVVACLQASALAFLAKARGVVFAALCFPLLLIYNLACVTGLCAGLLGVEQRRDRWLVATALGTLCLILGLQIAGGAYRAGFDGDPDESGHFVSSLMVYDYLAAMPKGNPMAWAENYYLHYPKVAIGHWPPGYYAVEAFWWLVIPPSRQSALWLNGALIMLAAMIFHRLTRTLAPSWVAVAATALLIVSPVVQQSFDLTMADALCLLWSVLLADMTTRLLNRPSGGRLALAGLWIVCAMVTKGTGACLIPAPALALAATGKWKQIPRGWLWGSLAAALTAGLGWYAVEAAVFHHSLTWWGGMTLSMAWPVGNLPRLAGWGVVMAAAGGVAAAVVRRRPAAVSAACMLLSAVAVTFLLRAMNEPRHWIIVLPALLLLAVEMLAWLENRRVAATAVAALAVLLFPWNVYRQPEGVYAAFVAGLPRPARVLVSSDAVGEGALVAAIALSEPRPSSLVVRASRALAHSDWNGTSYHLTASANDVAQLLDEMGIDTIILHTVADVIGPAHHWLLRDTLPGNPSFRQCLGTRLPGTPSAGTLTEWRRVRPPVAARVPLRVDPGGMGLNVQEGGPSR